MALWESLRPHQWTKNLFLFAGILFSKNLFETTLFLRAAAAFGLFCLLSGAVYLLNDLVDLPQDQSHPVKRGRPLASGRLRRPQALIALALLFPLSLGAAFLLGRPFFGVTLSYLLLQAAYIFVLKQTVILDIFAIAGGFALRVIAGAVVISVEISSWLMICTIFLSLFIALGKRRGELSRAVGEGRPPRQVLQEYPPALLDQMISVMTACAVVAYALYTTSEETILRFGSRNLVYTIPLVLYGFLRYLYLIHQKGAGEEPERTLLTDRPLLLASMLWVLAAAWVIYG